MAADSPATRQAYPEAGQTAVSIDRSVRSPGVTLGRAGYEPLRASDANTSSNRPHSGAPPHGRRESFPRKISSRQRSLGPNARATLKGCHVAPSCVCSSEAPAMRNPGNQIYRRRTLPAKSSSVFARRSAAVSSRWVIGMRPYCAVSFRLSSSISALAARSPVGTICRRRTAASR